MKKHSDRPFFASHEELGGAGRKQSTTGAFAVTSGDGEIAIAEEVPVDQLATS
jgi:hypothetical protein